MATFNPHQNYFELFQIPESFRLDQQQLSERYRDLQREAHPDRFAGGTDRERLLAIQYSAWINEAYKTLQRPVKRAQYLLFLKGMDINPEQTMASDPAFLMHQITLREQMMELREQADPEGALDTLVKKLDKLLEHQCTEFEQNFNEQSYSVAKEAVMKMQFLYKLEEDAQGLEADILDY